MAPGLGLPRFFSVQVGVILTSNGTARRVQKGEHPALILKRENPPCSFGLAPCPFQNIKTLKISVHLIFLFENHIN